MFLQQPVTNTTAHQGSSAEFAKWRDADEDPELLSHRFHLPVDSVAQAPADNNLGPAWSEAVSGRVQPTSKVLGSLATDRFEG